MRRSFDQKHLQELVAGHFQHLQDMPFYLEHIERALTLIQPNPSFPQPGYPVILQPYAVIGNPYKPKSWPHEVARRLKLYPVLPHFEAGLSDQDLKRRFDVGICGLLRTDLLNGVLLCLEELREISIKDAGNTLSFDEQITAVRTDRENTERAEKERHPYSGGCPGGDIERDWVGRRCERGCDDCEV